MREPDTEHHMKVRNRECCAMSRRAKSSFSLRSCCSLILSLTLSKHGLPASRSSATSDCGADQARTSLVKAFAEADLDHSGMVNKEELSVVIRATSKGRTYSRGEDSDQEQVQDQHGASADHRVPAFRPSPPCPASYWWRPKNG